MSSGHPTSSTPQLGPVDYTLAALAAGLLVFAAAGFSAAALRGGAGTSDLRIQRLTDVPMTIGASPVLRESGSARPGVAVQRIDVDASSGTLKPNYLEVEAGKPVEIRFSEGHGRTAHIAVERLGVSVDLGSAPSVLSLPSMDPGAYPVVDGYGGAAGLLVAQ